MSHRFTGRAISAALALAAIMAAGTGLIAAPTAHADDPRPELQVVVGDPDVAAVGATVRADIGKPFDVKVGIRNAGTAQTHQGRDEAAYVEIPKGVHVQRADKRCRRSDPSSAPRQLGRAD